MSHLTLVTGGARSGKSGFAELLAAHPGLPVIYIATAQVYDEEMALRVRKHREQRPADWRLIEEPLAIPSVLEDLREEKTVILLDCVTLWLTNLLLADYSEEPDSAKPAESAKSGEAEESADLTNLANERILRYDERERRILSQVQRLAELAQTIKPQVILVTNEVGQGIVPDNPLARAYRDLAGRANQILARAAEKVYWVVAGYPIEVKKVGQEIIQSLTQKVEA